MSEGRSLQEVVWKSLELVVDWRNDGEEMLALATELYRVTHSNS